MNVHRFDEEQRLQWVKQRRSGALSVKEVMQQAGISRATLYNWLAEFPEQEEALEVAVAEAPTPPKIELQRSGTARWQMLQDALAVVDTDTTVRQSLVRQLVRKHTLSIAQACAIAGLSEDAFEHKARKPEAEDREVYEALCRLLEEDASRQFEELILLLRKMEPSWPRKQIRRIYKEARLYQLRSRKRTPPPVPIPQTPTEAEPEKVLSSSAPQRRQRPDAVWLMGITETTKGQVLFAVDSADNAGLGVVFISQTEGTAGEAALMRFLAETAEVVGMPRKVRVPGTAPFNAREVLRWAMQQQVSLQTASFSRDENVAEWKTLSQSVAKQLEEGGF